MSLSRSPQPGPRDNRTGVILTISILTAILVLLGIALLRTALPNAFALGPTPTPTPTRGPTYTPSPDVRATIVAEDMLTQVAYAATLVGGLTPGAQTNGTPQPGSVKLPLVAAPGMATPTSALYIPKIENQPTVTLAPTLPPGLATPGSVQPGQPSADVPAPGVTPGGFPTPIAPTPGGPVPGFPTPVIATPGALPPGFPTPVPPPGQPPPGNPTAALATPFVPTPIPPPVIPTPLPPAPTPTPAPPIGGELAATIRGADTAVRIGPSNVYTVTGTLPPNTGIRLRGRTPAGDWVYACCLPGTATNFWVRRAYVNIANNTLPTGAPTDADPNDARWLAVQPPDPVLTPRPTPTGVPLGDFPLAHFDSQNTGRVPALPNPPLGQGWTVFQQAAQGFVSPVAVSGPSVLASSQDNQLYSLDLGSGTQRWRYNLQGMAQLAPSLQDGLIYVVVGARTLMALQDQGGAAGVIWQSDLPFNATAPFNIWIDTLFIGAGEGGDARLIALRRTNPADRREFGDPNARVQQPAIGQETIFVGADRLWALDINFFNAIETVWTSPDVFNVATAPVYASPGVVRLAELYVADSGGTVHALDANTGVQFWTHGFGGPVTALAINENSVFIAGNGVVRAISRTKGETQWTVPVGGQVMGGPLVTSNRLLAVTQGGGVFLIDATNGGIVDAASSIPAQVPGGPAVSNTTVLVPASNATIYALRGP